MILNNRSGPLGGCCEWSEKSALGFGALADNGIFVGGEFVLRPDDAILSTKKMAIGRADAIPYAIG
jgi:hypothetical protein